jgi:pimeloyl-ACP methyl ester carboxylesterase
LFDTGPGFRKDASREGWNRFANSTAGQLEREGVAALGVSPEVDHSGASATGLAHAARGILAQHDATVMDLLPRVTVPTLVLVGADDTNFLAASAHMAKAIPDAEKVVIPNAGHAANIDQPAAFDRAVIDFLSRHAS